MGHERSAVNRIRLSQAISRLLVVSVVGLIACQGAPEGDVSSMEGGLSSSAGGCALAVTHWVDRSHPAASDSNPGTAELPWKTLTKAGKAAQPGDVVGIRAGVYTEGLRVQVSGAEGQRVVFRADPQAAPGAVVLKGKGVRMVGQSHIEVRDLRIEHCDGLNGNDQIGVRVEGTVGGPEVTDIVIAGNQTFYTFSSAISVWGVPWKQDPGDWRRVTDVTVAHNTIEHACEGGWNEQITVANGVQEFRIHHNEIKNNTDSAHGGEGIDVKEGCAFGKVHHNVIHDIPKRALYVDAGGRAAHGAAPTHHIDVYAEQTWPTTWPTASP